MAGIQLSDHQISLMQASFTSTYLGSSSLDKLTDIIKLSGVLTAEDKTHIDLFVPEQYTGTFFKNVQENRKISILFTSVYTLETYQIKGTYIESRPCTDEEVNYQKEYIEGFAGHRVQLGMKNGLVFRNYFREPSIAIRIVSEEIYEQTPKVGTGVRIR